MTHLTFQFHLFLQLDVKGLTQMFQVFLFHASELTYILDPDA